MGKAKGGPGLAKGRVLKGGGARGVGRSQARGGKQEGYKRQRRERPRRNELEAAGCAMAREREAQP